MKFRVLRGRKAANDYTVYVKTDGWELLSFEDLLRLLKAIFENEDRIYPTSLGFKGRKMLFEAIKEVYEGKPVTHVLGQYKLKPRKIMLHELM